uniref:Uncharacterized protein n=1 Tax=Leersia perrieri TaxID=77586 RepID=A0A0D9W4H9_9ORYZ
MARREVAREMRCFRARAVEVSERRQRYESAFPVMITEVADPRTCFRYVDEAELAGVDVPRDKLAVMVATSRVVAVVVPGGMGKTTLADQVYRKVKDQFSCTAFQSVSQKPDVNNILVNIFLQLGNNKKEHANLQALDRDGLINMLREFLQDKRYFVIIDDIWDVETWKIIKCALFDNGCGSRIMTTTRIHDIAQACCSDSGDHIYEIEPLNDMISRRIFFRRIFGSEEKCPIELKEAADRILEKCGGSPLAIITISSLLAAKPQTKDQWNQVKNSIGSALQDNPDLGIMRRILSLSYSNLPHHLKNCMLYMSIFPEDHEIEKRLVINRWIAEGFIHGKRGQNVFELGDIYFDDLINRCLIQPVLMEGNGQVKACRVHDMVLDFIISKAIEQNFVTILGAQEFLPEPGKVHRLTLQNYNEEDVTTKLSDLTLCHVRSFSIFGPMLQVQCSLEFKICRVLDLRGCQLKNDHLVKIINLRYLNISNTGITEIPRHFEELQFLETLDLSGNWIGKLPSRITQLHRLAYLCICWGTRLPDGIAKMKMLQELGNIDILRESTSVVEELGELINLRNLHISWIGRYERAHIESYAETLASSFQKLGVCKLRSLSFEMDHFTYDSTLLDQWCPGPHNVQYLELIRHKTCSEEYIPMVPDWVGTLLCLNKLYLKIYNIDMNGLQILRGMGSLTDLVLMVYLSPREKLAIGSSNAFEYLKSFTLEYHLGGSYSICPGGMPIIFEVGAMPRLRHLKLPIETKYVDGQFDFSCIHHLHSLAKAEIIVRCTAKLEVEVAEAEVRNVKNTSFQRNLYLLETTKQDV